MNSNKTIYEIIVNLICLVLLIGVTTYLFVSWGNIPDKIPAHYGFDGTVDRWGSKTEILILPIISWVFYIALTILGKFPKAWNTGVKTTEENRERVYRVVKDLLETVKLLMVAVFSYITIDSTISKGSELKFIWLFILMFFVSLVYFIIKLVRAK